MDGTTTGTTTTTTGATAGTTTTGATAGGATAGGTAAGGATAGGTAAGGATAGGTVWRKSTHSGGSDGCVEVADGATGVTGMLPVRDSKDPGGPVLHFPSPAWQAFVTAVRAGEFDGQQRR
ncbi:DUF397 domain-containing protein [Kitasatospora aureofaciens]|uniref:DUF397 domain-containing protein n=1 Tax=Kitasatospora aureofaciens TaxID=1894 RepID=UPI00380DDDCF